MCSFHSLSSFSLFHTYRFTLVPHAIINHILVISLKKAKYLITVMAFLKENKSKLFP